MVTSCTWLSRMPAPETRTNSAFSCSSFKVFGHELERVLDVLLEVAVGGAARHGADRAHTAVGLVGAALIEKHLARRLVGAGEERSHHGAVGAGGERLGEVAGI